MTFGYRHSRIMHGYQQVEHASWVNIGRPGCRQGGMLVAYLFGSCPKTHGTLALVHNEGVLCISCTVTGSYAINWVALSIILT